MSNLTQRQPLLLGGFMGTGKSTVGPLVAARAGVPFLDLDAAIEHAAGTTIASLFATAGEATFRTLEANTLSSLLTDPTPRVIALGGGTLLNPILRAEALRTSRVINLVAHPDTLLHRVRSPNSTPRPLLDHHHNPLDRIHELLATRAQTYVDAHTLIRTDHRDPHDIASAVLHAWQDKSLLVRTPSSIYAAHITHNAPLALTELVRTLEPSSLFLVTDDNVDPLYANAVVDALRTTSIPFATKIVLTPGEVHKQWPAVQQILEALVAHGADRSSLVVALGGGVVSDITGFAAAVLYRGIRWIAVPTTLLSMVDAAVGGKTAVDLGLAKNAVGAFHQPAGVIIHPAYTRSESPRAYLSGLAEVVKSAAIADPHLIHVLHEHHTHVLERDPSLVEDMVYRSLRVKADIVSRDERESGERMLLNFGHTIGHGLEAAGNYSQLTHGEAVALGMVAILHFGVARNITPQDTLDQLVHLLATLGLPTNLDDQPLDQALTLIAFDKKRVASDVRLIFLEQLGKPRIERVPIEEVRAFFTGHKTKRHE